jgi:hypothetical protein
MIDWRELWRNPKPFELDTSVPFGFGRTDDLPIIAYDVTMEKGVPALVLSSIHSTEPLELFRYRECERSLKRYRPCSTLEELEDMRHRSVDPSGSSLTRRELRRLSIPAGASPDTAGRLDRFIPLLLEPLRDPSSYNWQQLRDGLFEIYADTSIRQTGSEDMDAVHRFAEGTLRFISCVFFFKWLIGLGDCESDPDFDHLNYPRIDPEWKQMDQWETDIKWSVREQLRCEEEFKKDPDLRRALLEFKSRTGFELRLIKRTLLGTESCKFEIPEFGLSFGDFYGKSGSNFTPQDSALQASYSEVVAPIENRILDRMMKKQRLSESSRITFDPPLGSIHSLVEAMAWGPISMLTVIEQKCREVPDVEQIPNYKEAVGLLRRELDDLGGDSPQLRERASRHMEAIWCDQYAALGLRQDFQSKFIQALETLKAGARAMTTQPRRLQSAYYKLFFELETMLRDFIRTVLEKELGTGWWDSGIPDNLREKCQNEAGKAENLQGKTPVHPFEYCYFADLKRILEKRWSDNFRKFFEEEPGGSKDQKLAWLDKLIPIRNVLMHPRRPLSIRESWAVEIGSQRVEILVKKLGVFRGSDLAEQ